MYKMDGTQISIGEKSKPEYPANARVENQRRPRLLKSESSNIEVVMATVATKLYFLMVHESLILHSQFRKRHLDPHRPECISEPFIVNTCHSFCCEVMMLPLRGWALPQEGT